MSGKYAHLLLRREGKDNNQEEKKTRLVKVEQLNPTIAVELYIVYDHFNINLRLFNLVSDNMGISISKPLYKSEN